MASQTRAVLDTNVWLDWLLFADPGLAELRAAVAAGELRLVGSPHARDELADVLARPALRLQAQATRARRALPGAVPETSLMLGEFDALIVPFEVAADCGLACADPADQPFVDLAVAAGAHWLLTKDKALLALAGRARTRFGLCIAPPSRFVRRRGAGPDTPL